MLRGPRPPSGIPVSDPQNRDVTAVALMQSGITLHLLCLNVSDVGAEGNAVFLDDLTPARIAAEPQVRPLEDKTASVI
jgi:hypothetical protein